MAEQSALEMKEWCKLDKQRVYINSSSPEKVYLERLVKGIAKIRCRHSSEVATQTKRLAEAGFDFSKNYASWDELVTELFKLPGNHLRVGQKQFPQSAHQPPATFNPDQKIHYKIDIRPPNYIDDDTYSVSIASAPFKASTVSNSSILIDTREPDVLFKKLAEGRIRVEKTYLEVGDILLKNSLTSDHLVVERKTVSDLYAAITGSDKRAHVQAEKLFDYKQRFAKDGIRVQIIWIIEGEQNGRRMLYNVLPKSNQIDGFINYLVAILDQHVVQSYNIHHLSYLLNKFLQGFFERELYYPVRSDSGEQIDRTKAQRIVTPDKPVDTQYHGTSMPGRNSLFHVLTSFKNIDSRIANSLIESGLTLREILALKKNELIKFNGVGKILAEKIEAEFNM